MTFPPLPDQPLVSIRARPRLQIFPWRDLWAYRELLLFLAWRDLKVRYKQTSLGVAWVILQPLAATLIISLVFGRFGGLSQHVQVPYPLYIFSGMLPWTFFANAVNTSSNSLIGSTNLITKVYFPRLLIPVASVGAGLLDFCIGLILAAAMMLIYHVTPGFNLLLLPFFMALTALLGLSVGLGMSALSVRYRDVRYLLPFMMQLWMYSSPLIYARAKVPEQWRWVVDWNPMTGILMGFRSLLTGSEFPTTPLFIALIVTPLLFFMALVMFRRMERDFADII